MDEQNVGIVSNTTNDVLTTDTTEGTNPVPEQPVADTNESTAAAANDQVEEEIRAFSRSQFNNIIKRRLDRQMARLYARFGVRDEEELNGCIERLQAYAALEEESKGLKDELSKLREKNAFVENDIDPNRYDDIRAYFKGKELNFSDESLKQELPNHPEWVQVYEAPKQTTTIQAMGVDANTLKTPESDDEKMKRIFGIK